MKTMHREKTGGPEDATLKSSSVCHSQDDYSQFRMYTIVSGTSFYNHYLYDPWQFLLHLVYGMQAVLPYGTNLPFVQKSSPYFPPYFPSKEHLCPASIQDVAYACEMSAIMTNGREDSRNFWQAHILLD